MPSRAQGASSAALADARLVYAFSSHSVMTIFQGHRRSNLCCAINARQAGMQMTPRAQCFATSARAHRWPRRQHEGRFCVAIPSQQQRPPFKFLRVYALTVIDTSDGCTYRRCITEEEATCLVSCIEPQMPFSGMTRDAMYSHASAITSASGVSPAPNACSIAFTACTHSRPASAD